MVKMGSVLQAKMQDTRHAIVGDAQAGVLDCVMTTQLRNYTAQTTKRYRCCSSLLSNKKKKECVGQEVKGRWE
jgi:hypothetical protein